MKRRDVRHPLPGWDARLRYVIRCIGEHGKAYTSGRLPHQWLTRDGSLRCVVCGDTHTIPIDGFIRACPVHESEVRSVLD